MITKQKIDTSEISEKKTIGLVWLLTGSAITLGIVVLAVIFFVQFQLQRKINKQKDLDTKLQLSTKQTDELLNQYRKTTVGLLENQHISLQEDFFKKLDTCFDNLKKFNTIDFGSYIGHTTNAKTNANTNDLAGLYEACVDWNNRQNVLYDKIAIHGHELNMSLRKLKAIINKKEGKDFLENAFKIYHLKQSNNPDPAKALDILSKIHTYNTNSSEDIADIEIYCQQLNLIDNIGNLVNIKDNLFNQALTRLRKGISQIENRNKTSQASELTAAYDNFTENLFGKGYSYNNDRNIVPGENGYYELIRQKIEMNQQKTMLKSELNDKLTEIAATKKIIENKTNDLAKQTAQNIHRLLGNAFVTLLIICIAICLIFFMSAVRIARAIKLQVCAVTDANFELHKVNERLAIEIDTRQAAEQELEDANQKLSESNEQLSQFTYIASHDLREPLRKITSFGQILTESLSGKLNEEDQENFDYMIDGASRMQSMIEALLTYSRVTTHGAEFVQVDLNNIAQQLQSFELEIAIKEKNAKLTIPKPLCCINGDEAQIRQLIQNLIANGLKYQKQGDIPEIEIRSEVIDNGMVKIEVQDNGIGIKPENYDKVFAMFKRLHSRREYEGTGIGLAVCKKIVERHGGQIGVDSVYNQGTTFWFTMPQGECIKKEHTAVSQASYS